MFKTILCDHKGRPVAQLNDGQIGSLREAHEIMENNRKTAIDSLHERNKSKFKPFNCPAGSSTSIVFAPNADVAADICFKLHKHVSCGTEQVPMKTAKAILGGNEFGLALAYRASRKEFKRLCRKGKVPLNVAHPKVYERHMDADAVDAMNAMQRQHELTGSGRFGEHDPDSEIGDAFVNEQAAELNEQADAEWQEEKGYSAAIERELYREPKLVVKHDGEAICQDVSAAVWKHDGFADYANRQLASACDLINGDIACWRDGTEGYSAEIERDTRGKHRLVVKHAGEMVCWHLCGTPTQSEGFAEYANRLLGKACELINEDATSRRKKADK